MTMGVGTRTVGVCAFLRADKEVTLRVQELLRRAQGILRRVQGTILAPLLLEQLFSLLLAKM